MSVLSSFTDVVSTVFFGGDFFFFVRVPAIQDNNISVARSVELYCWDGVLYSTALI